MSESKRSCRNCCLCPSSAAAVVEQAVRVFEVGTKGRVAAEMGGLAETYPVRDPIEKSSVVIEDEKTDCQELKMKGSSPAPWVVRTADESAGCMMRLERDVRRTVGDAAERDGSAGQTSWMLVLVCSLYTDCC